MGFCAIGISRGGSAYRCPPLSEEQVAVVRRGVVDPSFFLPNLIWQARINLFHWNFCGPSTRVTAHRPRQRLSARTIENHAPGNFLFFWLVCTTRCFSRDGKRFRMLGWMYLIPLALFVVAKGRFYYLAAAYPMLYSRAACGSNRSSLN